MNEEAQKTREEAEDQACKAYVDAMNPVWDARDIHEKIEAQARKAYDEAMAQAKKLPRQKTKE